MRARFNIRRCKGGVAGLSTRETGVAVRRQVRKIYIENVNLF